MHDALVVRGVERVADLEQDRDRLGQRQPAAPQPRRERLALQPLHDEVAAPVGQLAEGEHVDDVRMADLVDRARLLHEALDLHRRRRTAAGASP